MTRFLPIVQVFIYLKINLFPHIWFINYEKFNNSWFVMFINFFVSLKYFFSLNRTFFSATNISHCFSFIRFRWKISTEWMKFNWIKKKTITILGNHSVRLRCDERVQNIFFISIFHTFYCFFSFNIVIWLWTREHLYSLKPLNQQKIVYGNMLWIYTEEQKKKVFFCYISNESWWDTKKLMMIKKNTRFESDYSIRESFIGESH